MSKGKSKVVKGQNSVVPETYELTYSGAVYRFRCGSITLRDLLSLVSIEVDVSSNSGLAVASGDYMQIHYKNYERAVSSFSALSDPFYKAVGSKESSVISKELIKGFSPFTKHITSLVEEVSTKNANAFKEVCKSRGLYIETFPFYEEDKVDITQEEIMVEIKGNKYYLPVASDKIGNRKAFEEKYYGLLRNYTHLDSDSEGMWLIRDYLTAACRFSVLIPDFCSLFAKKSVLDIEVRQTVDFMPMFRLYDAYYSKYTEDFMKDLWEDEDKELSEATEIYKEKVKEEGVKRKQHAASQAAMAEQRGVN